MSGHISLRLGLLDKQLVDCDRLAIGRVDDLELEIGDGGGRVARILVGAEALGERLGGGLGSLLRAPAARLRHGRQGPAAVDPQLVEQVEPHVRLSAGFSDLPDLAGLERWLARHVVGRIPGAGRASD